MTLSRAGRDAVRELGDQAQVDHADLLHGHNGGMNKTGSMEGIRTLAGYANTSSHGRVRFVISLTSNDDEMRFRLLRTIQSEL